MQSFIHSGRAQRGFTLIELLVAVAVFAIMVTIAYSGLASVLNARSQTRQAGEQLADLQLAVSLLSHDIQQAVPRSIRGRYGDPMPALQGGAHRVELTRAGHANPVGLKRSTLQRIAWSVESGELTRWSWPVLDRARDTAPVARAMLDQVQGLRWRYLADGVWYEQWPPRGNREDAGTRWPQALEFTLILDDAGRISRLIPLVARHRNPLSALAP